MSPPPSLPLRRRPPIQHTLPSRASSTHCARSALTRSHPPSSIAIPSPPQQHYSPHLFSHPYPNLRPRHSLASTRADNAHPDALSSALASFRSSTLPSRRPLPHGTPTFTDLALPPAVPFTRDRRTPTPLSVPTAPAVFIVSTRVPLPSSRRPLPRPARLSPIQPALYRLRY